MNFLQIVQPIRPIIDHSHEQPLDQIVLIPNHLKLSIYNHGNGLFFSSGQFLQIRQSIYLQKSLQLIKYEMIDCVFNRAQLIPALQIALSFLKQDSKARIWTSYHLAYGDQKISGVQYRANLFIDVHVIKATKIPTNMDKDVLNILFFEEILEEGRIGNKYMAQLKYQKAFQLYQSSVKKIFSQQFRTMSANFLNSLKKNHQNDKNKATDQQNRNKKQKFDKVLDKCNIICFKFLQLGVCVGQSFILKISENVEQLKIICDFDKNLHLDIIVINGSKILHQVKEASRCLAQYNRTIIKIIEYITDQVKQINTNKQSKIPSNQLKIASIKQRLINLIWGCQQTWNGVFVNKNKIQQLYVFDIQQQKQGVQM